MDPCYTGSRIAELRKAKGWTQKEVADRTHVTVSAVSKWERGLNFPDLAVLEPLAGALGVPVTELLGLEDEKPEQIVRQIAELSRSEQENARRRRRNKLLAAVCAAAAFFAAAAAVYLAVTDGSVMKSLSGGVGIWNLAAVVLGLAAWAFAAVSAFAPKAGRWCPLISWLCCALSLHIPVLTLYLLMRFGAGSTAEDVVGADYFSSAILLFGTAALQICGAVLRRERTGE